MSDDWVIKGYGFKIHLKVLEEQMWLLTGQNPLSAWQTPGGRWSIDDLLLFQ